MANHPNSLVVVQIQPQFWWMQPMSMWYNRAKFEQEAHQWERVLQVADLGFKLCQKLL